jgi:8-amino-7-oxononanoate synthase
MDIFGKCYNDILTRRANEAREAGLYPYFIPLSNTEATEVTIGNHRLIMIGSNNYLGLTTHPKVRQAAIEATERFGPSCTGSPFLNGTLELHLELRRRLAEFVGKDAALVFPTGMQVNLGTISAVVGRGDFVITDKDDHASIMDGCRLSFGKTRRFNHSDMDHLDRVLAGIPENAGKLVVVDGVYSMGGDIAPLPEIVKLCKKHGARVMVDDAHSIGVLGGGRGTAAHFGLTDEVDLIMGTFSKSFASLGGFIAGNKEVIDYIQHHARALIFSASITPASTAAAMAALEVIQEEPERIARVNEIGERMRREYRKLGFNVGVSETPVVPIIIGDDIPTVLAWKTLYDAGVYTNPVVPPGVPPESSRLRTSYMATHTDEQLDRVVAAFADLAKMLDLEGKE